MRNIFTLALFLIFAASGYTLRAQAPDGLTQDAKGRYTFVHSSNAGVPKDMLYERMRHFILEDLNPSDNYLIWDERGHDSVVTVAFLELENAEDLDGQIVECKARLQFNEGAVTLRLKGFVYSATINGKAYTKPMHRLNGLPYFAQSYASTAFYERLRQLAEKMDAAAARQSDTERVAKKAKSKGRHAKS